MKDFSIGGVTIWPATMPFSIIAVLVAVAVALLVIVRPSRTPEGAAARDPLFEMSQFRLKTYRYGLITVLILAMGQLGSELRAADLPAGRHAPHRAPRTVCGSCRSASS